MTNILLLYHIFPESCVYKQIGTFTISHIVIFQQDTCVSILFLKNRQQNMRRILRAVIYLLRSCNHFSIFREGIPRVWISVEAREIAAGYIHAYPVSLFKDVAGRC